MLVRQILGMKGGTEVVTIAAGVPVSEAARLLSERRIGAVVVTDGDAPVGILSERDIVRELGRRGDACLRDSVDDLMTRKLISCAPDDTADHVLATMTEGRFRHLPVIEADRMIGLISIGDLNAELQAEQEQTLFLLTEYINGRV